MCSLDDLSKLNRVVSGIKKNSKTKYNIGRIDRYPRLKANPET